MKNIIIFCSLVLTFLVGCNNTNPKVVYNEDGTIKADKIIEDTTKMKVADLPFQIDSTNYLVHALGEVEFYGDSFGRMYESSSRGSYDFNVSNNTQYGLSGRITNLKFENIETGEISTLTENHLLITTALFLKELQTTTAKELFLYKIHDADTNGNNKLDTGDIESLYLSGIDGSNFKKITKTNEDLLDWKYMAVNNRLYLKTIEDTNKNGKYEREDTLHYAYIDLNSEELKTIYYNP